MKRRFAWAARLLRPARRPGGRAGRAWIAHNVVDHQSVPDEQHDHRADGRVDRPAPWSSRYQPMVWPMKVARKAGNAEQRRQDETFGLVRSRRQESSDDADAETDHDDPDDVRPDNLLHARLCSRDANVDTARRGCSISIGMLRRRVREMRHKSVKRDRCASDLLTIVQGDQQ